MCDTCSIRLNSTCNTRRAFPKVIYWCENMNKITDSDSAHTHTLTIALAPASISRACCETKLYFVHGVSERLSSSNGGSRSNTHTWLCVLLCRRTIIGVCASMRFEYLFWLCLVKCHYVNCELNFVSAKQPNSKQKRKKESKRECHCFNWRWLQKNFRSLKRWLPTHKK